MNKKFLNHNSDTDILTFDYSVDNEISAEAFISYEALEQNAKKNNQSITKEDSPSIRGMIKSIEFMLRIEEI